LNVLAEEIETGGRAEAAPTREWWLAIDDGIGRPSPSYPYPSVDDATKRATRSLGADAQGFRELESSPRHPAVRRLEPSARSGPAQTPASRYHGRAGVPHELAHAKLPIETELNSQRGARQIHPPGDDPWASLLKAIQPKS
jgi:hypothetical protein